MNEDVYLLMGDGTKLAGTAGYASKVLWLYLVGITLQEAAAVAFDPAKTAEIAFVCGGERIVYRGFTEVGALINAETEIKIQLLGENTEVVTEVVN